MLRYPQHATTPADGFEQRVDAGKRGSRQGQARDSRHFPPDAPRQRHVRHETRCRPGGEPALCAPARAPVLLRDLHLAHHRQRPAGLGYLLPK